MAVNYRSTIFLRLKQWRVLTWFSMKQIHQHSLVFESYNQKKASMALQMVMRSPFAYGSSDFSITTSRQKRASITAPGALLFDGTNSQPLPFDV